MVQVGLNELLDAPDAFEKVVPLLAQIVGPLRQGLSQGEKDLFLFSLAIFKKLVVLVGQHIVSHLTMLLPPIASKVMHRDLDIREAIYDMLTETQIQCGPEGLMIIRAKVPTYSQLF